MKTWGFSLGVLLVLGLAAAGCPAGCSDGEASNLKATGGESGAGAGVGGGQGGAGTASAGRAGVSGKAGGKPSPGGSAGTGGVDFYCEDGQPPWTCDPAFWKPTSISGDFCQMVDLDLSKITFPKQEWTSCGSGCLLSDAAFFPADYAKHSSGAFYKNGETYLNLSMGWGTFGGGQLSRIVRVSDGTTIAASFTSITGTCGTLQYGRNAPSFTIYFSSKSGDMGGYTVGQFLEKSNSIQWYFNTIKYNGISASAFDFDGGCGVLTEGGLGVVESKNQAEFKVLGGSPSYSADGQGSVVVWPGVPEPKSKRNIRRYSKNDGISTVFDNPAGSTIERVALSDDHLTWISVNSDGSGLYSKAFLSWSEFPSTPAMVKNVTTIPLPATTGLLELRTFGDYAATSGCEDDCTLYVAQLSTGKLWRIFSRPGNGFTWVMGMSPTEIIVGEIKQFGDPISVERVVRLDVSRLDDLAAAWKP